MSAPRDTAVSVALQAAVMGGRVSGFDRTGNDMLDALLTCIESSGGMIPAERISAATRVRPTSMEQAARSLGIAVRRVDLSRDSNWWRSDTESLVVKRSEQWCAVISDGGRQAITSPASRPQRLTADAAIEVSDEAWALVPTLPEGSVGSRAVWTLAWTPGARKDLLLLVLLGLATSALGIVVPLASGTIVGELVPSGDVSRILFVTVILLLAAAVTALVVVAQTIVTQRMSGRLAIRFSSALYERLVRLRSAFHRDHLPGELAGRLTGVESFSSGVGSALPTLISLGSLLLSSAFVLARVSGALTIAVLALSGLVLIVTAIAIPGFLRDAQSANEVSLELSGETFAMLGGISKIRMAGAEDRMLNRWLMRYARQQAWTRDQGRRAIFLGLIATIPASLIPFLLVLVEVMGIGNLDLGAFTTATAAAAQAGGAIAGLVPVILTIAALLPAMRALRPILIAEPEPRGSAADAAGELVGHVAFEHVSFAYEANAPLLTDISFEVPAGSMTAIVGPSGSGKTTLVRLLLGLEQPLDGNVMLDGRSLGTVDRISVLHQMGVVPQDAALSPGSILDNILGSAVGLGEDAAWIAAERAGLADDIRAMPMGMRTVISDGASTFSGGQRQRIMIARAVVREPKILVLDEATSALDNRTQEQVAEAIAGLGATRIVIAHRLSTIRMADRIIVMSEGRIIEAGTYGELMELGGTFAVLATRQMAEHG